MLEDLKMALLRHRVETGETQRDVCRKTQIPEVRLSNIIYMRERPTLEEQLALCKLLGYSRRELFNEYKYEKP